MKEHEDILMAVVVHK